MKKVECKIYSFDSKNNNYTVIPKDVFQKAIDEYNQRENKFGELGVKTEVPINLESVSHTIEKLEINDDDLVCKVNLLDTPNGRLVQALTDGGYPLKMKPRMVLKPIYKLDENGNETNEIIGYETPEIISIDIVN